MSTYTTVYTKTMERRWVQLVSCIILRASAAGHQFVTVGAAIWRRVIVLLLLFCISKILLERVSTAGCGCIHRKDIPIAFRPSVPMSLGRRPSVCSHIEQSLWIAYEFVYVALSCGQVY